MMKSHIRIVSVISSVLLLIGCGDEPEITKQSSTVDQKAQDSSWLALVGSDLIAMRAFVDGLSRAGVHGGQVAQFFLGTDPATAQEQAYWINALNQHGGDPDFANQMMRLLGVEGLQEIYAGIGDIAPPPITAGYAPETIGPSSGRDVIVNGLGAGIAGCFATASREPTAGTTWAQGTDGGKAITGNRNTAAALFYYTANGGSHIGDDTLIAAGLSLTEGDTTSIGGPRGHWPQHVGGPHPEIVNPDAMFWWTRAVAVAPSGSQATMGNDQLFTHLVSGPGGHGYRASAVHELITAAIIDQALGDSPSGLDGARAASILADRLLDYVGGKPLGTPSGSQWISAPNPVNDGLRETTAQVMAVFIHDIYMGSDYQGESPIEPAAGYPSFSLTIDHYIFVEIINKIHNDRGAQEALMAGLRALTSHTLSQDYPTDNLTGFSIQAENMAEFSRRLVETIASAETSSVEDQRALRERLYSMFSTGVNLPAPGPLKPGASVVDMIISGELQASIHGSIEQSRDTVRDKVRANDDWITASILESFITNPANQATGTMANDMTVLLAEDIWPTENGRPKPSEEFTSDDWKDFSSILHARQQGNDPEGVLGREELRFLVQAIEFGQLRGIDPT